MSLKDRDEDDRPSCTSCGAACKSDGFTCAQCLKDVCDGCAHESEDGEVVCPEHAP